MGSLSRNFPSRRDRRSTDRFEGPARRPLRSFEILENRFLLSVATSTPKPIAQVETSSLQTLSEAPSTFNPPLAPVVGPTSSAFDAASMQDESFWLPGSPDTPAMQVNLLLASNQTDLDGELEVENFAHGILYDLSLNDILAVHVELPIASSPLTLGIDIRVSPPNTITHSPGSFQVWLYWNQDYPAGDPFQPAQPQNLNSAPPPVGGVSAVDQAFNLNSNVTPTTSVSRNLPTSFAPPKTDGSAPSPVLQASPSGPPAASANHSTGIPTSDSKASPAGTIPSSPTGRTANVGPLPLSEPTPDGGIFAELSSRSPTSAPIVETTNQVETSHVTASIDRPQTPSARVQNGLGLGLWILPFTRPSRTPLSFRFDADQSSEPDEAEIFMLPPLSTLTMAGRSGLDGRTAKAPSEVERQASGNKKLKVGSSVVSALTVTASLFFSLFAPECLIRLSAMTRPEPVQKRNNQIRRGLRVREKCRIRTPF